MKRIVLFFASLLMLVGNVWADYTCTLATNEVTVSTRNTSSQTLGGTAQVKNITVQIRTNATSNTGNFYVSKENSNSNEIYNGAPNWTAYPATPTVNKSYDPAEEISTIYFNNRSRNGSRFYKDITLTIAASTHNFGGVLLGSSATWTFNVFATSSPTITSTDERFAVSVGTKSGNAWPVTVTFTPTEYKSYSADIKMGNGNDVVATVTGTGSKTGACAAQTYNNIALTTTTSQKQSQSDVIGTTKNQATISFSYSSTGNANKVIVYLMASETENGPFTEYWRSEGVKSGTGEATLPSGYKYFRFHFNYDSNYNSYTTTFSNITAKQAVYFEPDDTPIDFGTLAYGASGSSSVSIDYSSASADVTCDNCDTQYFTFTPAEVGAIGTDHECDYGSTNVAVKFNENGEAPAGDYSATLYVGKAITLSAKVLPQAPTLQVTEVRSTAVSVSWNQITNADSYKVYKNNVEVATVTGTSYTFTGLEQATEYNFSVKAFRGSDASEMSNVVTPTTYSVLTVVRAGAYADDITVTVAGEAGQWNADEKSFAKDSKATVTATCSNTCATFDKIMVGETVYGNPAEITMTAPATATVSYKNAALAKPVASISANNSKETISIAWEAVSCADSYTVYKDNVEVATGVTALTYEFTGLSEATEYSFKVKAVKGSEEAESDAVSATTYSVLTIVKAGAYADDITVTVAGEAGQWNADETSFAKDSKATVTASCTNTCATFDKIMVGETVYGNGDEITMTAPATATVSYKNAALAQPVASISANNSKETISIAWEAVSCADSYTVYKDNVEVATGVTALAYEFTGLSEATEYSFKVKAVKGSEEAESDAVSATTYTTSMNVVITGTFGPQGTASVTSTAWNATESSYGIGSEATVTVTSLPADCVVESIVANGTDITATSTFEVQTENSVTVTYRYAGAGVVEVIDEHGDKIYGTLTEAVDAAEDGATIKLLANVAQDMIVDKFIRFNGNGHSIDNLIIKENGNVELTGNVTIADFGIERTATHSGQFIENGGQITLTGKAYVDKTFDASGSTRANAWYSVGVPFPVSVADGIFKLAGGSESKATAGSDIIMYSYDGAIRAQTVSGRPGDETWIPVTGGYLQPGVFYILRLAKNSPNTFRFYKADGADLITLNKNIELHEYHAENPIHSGWNGIGNSQLYHVGVSFTSTGYAQILDANNKFVTIDLQETAFSVTTPMFIQSAADATATLSQKNDGTVRSASAVIDTYNLRIASEGASDFADQMFVSASSDATSTYTIGRDLAKFGVSADYPQLYTKAYDTNLSVHEAAYNENNIAEMPLYIKVPAAGNYTLSLGKEALDGSTLYLVKDGSAIHNFNEDGAYTMYLAKGTDSSYSLRIANGNGDIPTEVAENTGSQVKVYVKEHVLYICGLASGENYMVGDLTRTLYAGTSNGSTIAVPLTAQGVYWVKSNGSAIKVLNK